MFGHKSYTASIAFSPEGKYLLSCGSKNNRDRGSEVALWEVDSGRLQKMLRLDTATGDEVRAVAFSPNGSQIQFASRSRSQVWDRSLSSRLSDVALPAAAHQEDVGSMAFGGGGRVLATRVMPPGGGPSRAVLLWDVRTGRKISLIQNHGDYLNCAALSPDATRIIALSSNPGPPGVEILEFEARTGKRLRAWPRDPFGGWGSVIAIAPDGKSLAVPFSSDGPKGNGLVMLDTRTQAEIWKQTSPALADNSVPDTTALAFSPDGRWLAVSRLGIEVRDARTGALKQSYEAHGGVNALAFSPDSRTLAVAGGLIELHDLSDLAQKFRPY